MAEDALTHDPVTGEVAEPFDAEVAPSWRIDGLGTLDWALAKLAGIEREQEQNRELAEAARNRVDTWLLAQNKKLDQSAAFFRGHITAYANEHKAELLTGKKKSRDLPNGKVAWRKVGGRVRVVDGPTAIRFCEAEGLKSFVKYEPRLAVDELLHWLSGLSELPPGTGCEIVPEEDRLTITATGNELTKTEES